MMNSLQSDALKVCQKDLKKKLHQSTLDFVLENALVEVFRSTMIYFSEPINFTCKVTLDLDKVLFETFSEQKVVDLGKMKMKKAEKSCQKIAEELMSQEKGVLSSWPKVMKKSKNMQCHVAITKVLLP